MREAEVLVREGFFSGAIARACYAIFHAVKALLLKDGIECKTHDGLGRMFSLHFLKTGQFDTRFARILSKAQANREEADYSSEFIFTREGAEERVAEAREMIAAIKRVLAAEKIL